MDNLKLYEKLIKKYSVSDVRSLGWGSKTSQGVRFNVLAGIGITNQDTVLDVGCGYGDFSVAVTDGLYTGFDIVPAMIAEAKKRYPTKKFVEEYPKEGFDYIVASGVFNLPDADMGLIHKMFATSKKGIAVNFLCRYKGMEEKKDRKYHEPADIIQLIGLVTTKWVIRHDYRHNDFTLYAWR